MSEAARPLVSVLVPAFNAAPFLAEALESARRQTLADIEILVIDDASTDGTAAVAARLATRDPRIRLVRQSANGGPSMARNRGLTEARGRWIALLDADDAYAPCRLASLVALAERSGADLCSDNLWLVPAGRPMIPPPILSTERPLDFAEFIRRNVTDRAYPGLNFGFLKPIIRRAFLAEHAIRYDERVRFAEDFALYAECFRAGGQWWLSPASTYHYRVRADSLTQVQTVHDLAILRARQAGLLQEARQAGDRKLRRLVARHKRVVDRCYHYRAFTDALKARRFSGALRLFADSPQSAVAIIAQACRETPVIARKALRGGYRRPAGTKAAKP
jgi:glycosyltransferase involved in cell wall biosynthesis